MSLSGISGPSAARDGDESSFLMPNGNGDVRACPVDIRASCVVGMNISSFLPFLLFITCS